MRIWLVLVPVLAASFLATAADSDISKLSLKQLRIVLNHMGAECRGCAEKQVREHYRTFLSLSVKVLVSGFR